MKADELNVYGRVAVVGVGATEQGELPGRTGNENAAEAFGHALEDAGLAKGDIDGLITCKSIRGTGVDTEMGALLGLNPRYSATLDYGTCNFSVHLAAMALSFGMASVIALTYGTDARSATFNFGVPMGDDVTRPYGYVHMAGPAALAFRRHQHLYGTTEEQLGHIAVQQRANAMLNPLAVFRNPLSLDDYLDSPYVVEPLRRHDLTMISDGGACLIMTSAERATSTRNTPVYLLSMAETSAFGDIHQDDHLMRPWLRDVADRLYRSIGSGPADIDLLFIQDPTAVWVLQMLEWYGFCEIGEAGPFVAEGHTALHGKLPVNTNGGQLSESYMWGWLHLCELVRQLRGDCGARQVTGAEVAMYASSLAFHKGAASIFGVKL